MRKNSITGVEGTDISKDTSKQKLQLKCLSLVITLRGRNNRSDCFRIAAPTADRLRHFRCIIYDSWFDKFRGAVACVLVKEGSVARGDVIRSFHAQKRYEVVEVGIMHPGMTPVQVSMRFNFSEFQHS